MIDIHSHILYDLDDGARTLDESLQMARLAAEDGTRVIVATPHSPASTASRHYHIDQIRARVNELNHALAAEQVLLEVVVGTEISYDDDMLAQLTRGELLTYGDSRAILMELARNNIPENFDQHLRAILQAGYRVVLAHPERVVEVQADPNVLLPFIEAGVLMQVTAVALTGAQGPLLRDTAETLLTHGMIHIIASDTHGLPPRRPPLLAAARARATELIGAEAAEVLVTRTPAAVLAGQALNVLEPQPVDSAKKLR